jgi:3-hydroxyacyl-CoA dehydrogenase/enoyl-CoA hydratase/3-hydroxybutyryl-CoA epimerase
MLATNTSSLKLEDLRSVLQKPERLVGIHFFNPVAMMPLVEVVGADGADPAMLQAACAFVRQIDKLPLPVKERAGLPGQCRARPLYAGSDACGRRGKQPGNRR